MFRRNVTAILGLWLARNSSMLVADGVLTVLRNPYPAGYPSTNPRPNGIVANLATGQRVRVKSNGYGEDYMYYEVRLSGGRTGYVIYGDGPFHLEKSARIDAWRL